MSTLQCLEYNKNHSSVGIAVILRIIKDVLNENNRHYTSPVTRKSVFGFRDQSRLKPACSATEKS